MDVGDLISRAKGIPDETTRRIITELMQILARDISFGEPENQTRAGNTRAVWQSSTTPTSTGEFSIVHGLGRTPQYAIPVLELDHVGSKAGSLTVTRAADAKRVYLKADAGSTSSPVLLMME